MDAVISGFFGATTAVLAKTAMSANSPIHATIEAMCNDRVDPQVCTHVNLVARGTSVVVLFVLNVVVLTKFLKGMKMSGTAATTAITTGVNFATTAVYSLVLFNEEINNVWLVGFTLILAGVAVLSRVTGGGAGGKSHQAPARAGSDHSSERVHSETEPTRSPAKDFASFELEQKELADKQLKRRKLRQANRLQGGGYSPTTFGRKANRDEKIEIIAQRTGSK